MRCVGSTRLPAHHAFTHRTPKVEQGTRVGCARHDPNPHDAADGIGHLQHATTAVAQIAPRE
jgi:hypothetical protein